MKILIEGHVFEAELAQTPTGEAFARLLPIELEMTDLNSNEKYYYTSAAIPVQQYQPGRVETGDLMLWQNDCIVLFYKSFDTPFPYSRIGRILNPAGLAELISLQKSVRVKFEA